MEEYENNLPSEIAFKNEESKELFSEYTTEQLKYELGRRRYEERQHRLRSNSKVLFNTIQMVGEVVAVYRHNRPIKRWEYRIKDISVIGEHDKKFYISQREQENGLTFTLSVRFFKDTQTPEIGERVKIQFTDTPNCDKVWKTRARIVEVLRPEPSIESECKY